MMSLMKQVLHRRNWPLLAGLVLVGVVAVVIFVLDRLSSDYRAAQTLEAKYYTWCEFTPDQPQWVHHLLGDRYWSTVTAAYNPDLDTQRESLYSGETSFGTLSPEEVNVLLSRCDSLKELHLRGGWITDSTIESIREMSELRSLTLSETNVTAQGMGMLSSLPSLEFLTVKFGAWDGSGLEWLSESNALQVLDLADTKANDETCQAIGSCRSLRDVNLSYTAISDQGLAELRTLPKLDDLHVGYTAIKGTSFDQLHNCPISSLWVRGTVLGDVAIGHLAGWSKLEELILDYSHLGKEPFLALDGKSFPMLETMSLEGCKATGEWLVGLDRLPRLKKLECHASLLTDQVLKGFSSQTLEVLEVGFSDVTNRGLEMLGELPRLEWIDLTGTQVTVDGLECLERYPRLSIILLPAEWIAPEEIKTLEESHPQWKIDAQAVVGPDPQPDPFE
jgi:hypothetical protein